MHLSDHLLRASLDGELTPDEQHLLQEHLPACADCRERLAEINRYAQSAQMHLAILQPGQKPMPASAALQKLKHKETTTMQKTPFLRIPRLAWGALTFAAVLAVALSFQPVRALAGNFLNLFRIQQIQVLPVDMTALNDMRFTETGGQALTQMFSDSVKVIREGGETQKVATAAEASQLAGFTARTAQGQPEPHWLVKPGTAFEVKIDTERAQAVLNDAGRDDIQLPTELNGVVVNIDIPTGITAGYGDCRYEADGTGEQDGPATGVSSDCLLNLQVPSPIIQTTPEIDPVQLAKLGLRFLGKSVEEADTLSKQIDWSSTLVLPVPMGEAAYENVSVDGVQGTLVRQTTGEEKGFTPAYTLMWVKDGILNAVIGTGDAQPGIDLANSLQ